MKQRFNGVKDPAETIPLTFDFSAALAPGEILQGVPAISVTCPSGIDSGPSIILDGPPAFVLNSLGIVQAITGGIPGAEYEIQVVVATSNQMKVLSLTGILQVSR